MSKQDNKKDNSKRDRIIQIILIIIIILLLLHNCSLVKNRNKEDNGKINIIDITSNDKCDQEGIIDCLEDENNSKCIVPDFVGKNKKDVLKWLSSLSNTIELEIVVVEQSDAKDGTVTDQTLIGSKVKDLIKNKKKLVITIVNNGSLVDCEKDSQNSQCILPNFVGEKEEDVVNWLDGLANNIKVKYVYMDSKEPAGTIINQSISAGKNVKEILTEDLTLVIYLSRGKKGNPSTDGSIPDKPSQPDSDETEPITEDDFYVNDKDVVRWEDESSIKIFEDSTHIAKVNGKIAPESSGTYKFVVNNGTKYTLKYKIRFTETNSHNMNMKFKLKKGNIYLIDHYVSCDELNIENMTLNVQTSEDYYLEWKWVGDNDTNDTTIGNTAQNTDIEYNLAIKVEAESI